MQEVLTTAGIENEIQVYEGAPHRLLQRRDSYRARAATGAWQAHAHLVRSTWQAESDHFFDRQHVIIGGARCPGAADLIPAAAPRQTPHPAQSTGPIPAT